MSWIVLKRSGDPFHEEPAVRVVHVLDRGFEQMTRQQPCFLLDLARRNRECRAADGGRSAAVGAPPHRGVVRVAVHDLHVVDTDAKLVGHDLREGRFLPLAVRRRADEHVHLAGRVHPDDRAFPQTSLEPDRARHLRRAETADLDVGRDADADVAALRARRRLLPAEVLVADVRQRLVEHRLVIAAVVLEARDHIVAVVERRNQIAPPDFSRVHTDLVREQIEEALEHERGFGTSGPAVRLDRRRVRVDAVDILLQGRHLVRAGQHQAMKNRRNAGRGGRQIRAHASPHGAAQAEDACRPSSRQARRPARDPGRASSPDSSRIASRSISPAVRASSRRRR